MWQVPEQIKSQRLWSPTMTFFIHQEEIVSNARELLGVDIGHVNKSNPIQDTTLTNPAVRAHLIEHHSWDLRLYGESLK